MIDLINLIEKLSELMHKNLGLEKDDIKDIEGTVMSVENRSIHGKSCRRIKEKKEEEED
jgi:hypothetical protein